MRNTYCTFGSLDLVPASVSFNNVSIMCEFHKEIVPKFVIVTVTVALWSSGTSATLQRLQPLCSYSNILTATL